MIKGKHRKGAAILLTFAILTGALTGCGDKGQGDDGSAVPSPQGGGAVPEQTAGRYVERQEELPEELKDWTIQQMFAAEDKLHLLISRQEDGKTVFREWEKQGDGYADVTQGWLASLELSCGDWVTAKLTRGGDGREYLYAGYVAQGEDNFKAHLWKGDGDGAEEITPEKWAVPDEKYGNYEMIQGVAALNNGTLFALSYSTADILSGEDGSVLESMQPESWYEGNVMTDGENVYLCSSEGAGGRIEVWKDGKSADMATIPYPAADGGMKVSGADGGAISVGGSGNMALSSLKDGTLIAGGEDGLFRMTDVGAEGKWELLVEGVDTDFSVSGYSCTDLTALEDGSIYALFMADGETKLNRYEYDPNAVSQVTQVLRLYTVYESSLLKQAAVMYHKAHPEVRVIIENEYPMYFYGDEDMDAVYQKLNTMLMGDDAPDILVMDGLNLDSYASKGLLEDLEDIVKPMEDSGELLANITSSYVREDGKRYAVPLQFSFDMAIGRDIAVENMSSMEALAAFLSGTDYSYMGERTVAELVDEFYPYFCEEIVSDKQLNKEVLNTFLKYLKAIADNCGIIASRPENTIADGMWELGAQRKLALQQVTGFMDCMFPMSMVKYIKGDFTAFENSFSPSLQMGICTKSQYPDTAKDFLKFALSQEIQDRDYYGGFPVNKESLMVQAAKDRSDYAAVASIMTDDGGYEMFESEPYSRETADRLAAMCGTLSKPVKKDAKIREVLIESLEGYLNGTQSEEATIQKVEDGLKMYLAE